MFYFIFMFHYRFWCIYTGFISPVLFHVVLFMRRLGRFDLKMDVTKMERFMGPVNPEAFPQLTMILCGLGLLFTAWFMYYEVTSTKFTRNFVKETMIATVASVFLGFGSLFLLLWVGIYV